MVSFAVAYADQTEADWQQLRKSKHALGRTPRSKAVAAKQ